jgi:hypothetical protein
MIGIARLRGLVGVEGTDDDAVLSDLLAQAIETVEGECGRYFREPQEVEHVLVGYGVRDSALLPDAPVAGDTITVTEQEYPGATPTALAEGVDYDVRVNGRFACLARRDRGVWKRGWEYVVVYTRGFDFDALPRDVESVIVSMIARRYASIGSAGLRSETIGGYSYTRAGDGGMDEVEGLRELRDRWRIPVYA